MIAELITSSLLLYSSMAQTIPGLLCDVSGGSNLSGFWLVILLCIQVECYDPRPRGEPVDTFAVGLEGSQGVAQLIFDGIQAVENAVVEGLLPEFAPQIFHGIELWGIGW